MGFQTPAKRKKLTLTKNTGIPTRNANATAKAGPKNSNLTKPGASRSINVNRDSGNTPRSKRVNYKQLRTIVK